MGKDTVLIIDEAQDLTPELLEQVRLLSNLETDERKLLQIVLMGQPELRDRLNDHGLRQLRQRITIRYHLNPLRATKSANTCSIACRFPGPTARLISPRRAVAHLSITARASRA
jgi:general secretion pathway protein A